MQSAVWGVIINCRAMHAPPTQVIVNGSGGRVRPQSTSPFRLPRLSNHPRVLLVFGGVDLPASARALMLPAAVTRPLCGRPRGVEPWFLEWLLPLLVQVLVAGPFPSSSPSHFTEHGIYDQELGRPMKVKG